MSHLGGAFVWEEVELLVFDTATDGLLRAVGADLTYELEAQLTAAGLRRGKNKLPAYPLETWREFLRICAEGLFPSLSEEEGYRCLGERFIEGYFTTGMGRALASVARMVGPKGMLGRATHSFRSANNFTETRLTEVGGNVHELWMNNVDQPDFTTGIIEHVLRTAGAKAISVEARKGKANACTFRIHWQ